MYGILIYMITVDANIYYLFEKKNPMQPYKNSFTLTKSKM